MDGIRDLLTDICLVGASVFSVAWVVLVNRGRLAQAAEFVSRLPRSGVAVFLFFAAIATVCAQKSGTNAPLRGASVELKVESGELESGPPHNSTLYTLNSQFLLDSVTTNDSNSYGMPTNATRCEKWWRRGGYEDVQRLDLGGFRFPLGTNLCDYLWVYTWGMAGARLIVKLRVESGKWRVAS